MNSEFLQKQFPEVYRDFYARNDLVLSGCFVLPWGYEGVGDNFRGYLKIKSTLPLKCFVGIKFSHVPGIKFGNVNFYDIVSNAFEQVDYQRISKGEDVKLKELIQEELDILGINRGVEIEILSETTRGHSFGFSGTSSAIIASGIYRISDFLKGIHKTDEEFFSSYLGNIFALSRKMDFILRFGTTLGHNALFTLIPNKGISYFIGEDLNSPPSSLSHLNTLEYEFIKVNNTYGIDLPFDYFIIFTGLPTDTKQVENYKKLEYTNQVYEYIDEKSFQKPHTYLSQLVNKKLVDTLRFDLLNVDSLKTLDFFQMMYTRPHDENMIHDFIEHLNHRRGIISITEKQSAFAEDFLYFFRKNQRNYSEKVGISPAYSGRLGGGYIVVTKQGLSRDTISKTIDELKTLYGNVKIEYCSYVDGTSDDGVQIEQFISQNIYSKYVDKNKVVYKDTQGANYLGNYGNILENEKEGLIFDTISNKMYFNGKKLTSKDIPSQNTTIGVISKLLENIGTEISNKDFPSSSYTGNKNEMLGKIILPFLKFIEEKTGEKLDILCTGSITDFSMKIGGVNLKIGNIKKI